MNDTGHEMGKCGHMAFLHCHTTNVHWTQQFGHWDRPEWDSWCHWQSSSNFECPEHCMDMQKMALRMNIDHRLTSLKMCMDELRSMGKAPMGCFDLELVAQANNLREGFVTAI